MDLDKFNNKLYRGDCTELIFHVHYYEEHNQWWIGYFDEQNMGWVDAVTGRHADRNIAIQKLIDQIESSKDRYFIHKPDSPTGAIYDKSVTL